MQRAFRKLDHGDFLDRINSVNRSYVRRTPLKYRRDRDGEKPWFYALVAFCWTWGAMFVATNRGAVEVQLKQSTLTLDMQGYAMEAIAAGLMISAVVLGYHFVRAILRRRRYYNSGSILAGFMVAVLMFSAPPEYYQKAFDLLDPRTQDTVIAAAQQVRSAGEDALAYVGQ